MFIISKYSINSVVARYCKFPVRKNNLINNQSVKIYILDKWK